ncbi:alpha/beta hydrolase [Alkalihalobacillus sp. CinArs1]|uniref:alpha/beta hydrolase n=1 Tax=Alkalihalobacillus sp. CinArs1 TaxID=2995314 RepID=UPI0022DD636D|nr:alpha/beta hydrolase [Alkalihalobacillus sp. CinArs1]
MKRIKNKHLPYHIATIKSKASKTIVLYHGWGSKVEGLLDVAETLFEEGFSVVIPELIYHDSRGPFANHFQPDIMQSYFWKTIFHSIDEFPKLLQSIDEKMEDVVLLGSSMGGFIANGIASKHSLGGLISVNGSGSFVRSETLFRKRDGRGEIPNNLLKGLKNYDLVEQACTLTPTLFLHGECDAIVPICGQEDYFRKVMEENRSHAEFRRYPGVGHEFTDEMVNDVLAWLHKLS